MAAHNDVTGINTITSIDTLRLICLSEIHIEIAIHRTTWFSKICPKPKHHNIFLSCMFGKLVEINEPSGVGHPHLHQLSNDLRLLRHIEDLAEYVDIIVNDPMILITNNSLNHTFTNTDFIIIRHRFIDPAPPRVSPVARSSLRATSPTTMTLTSLTT